VSQPRATEGPRLGELWVLFRWIPAGRRLLSPV